MGCGSELGEAAATALARRAVIIEGFGKVDINTISADRKAV